MTDKPEIERVLVDPQTAARWLAGVAVDYVATRLHRKLVADYVTAMRHGEWQENPHDVIYLDEDGVALTGLMRLTAVIFANVRVWMYVQRDMRRSDLSLTYGADTHPDLMDFARTAPSNRL